MNQYALNTVAINGWEQFFGASAALIEMQADAELRPAKLGTGEARMQFSTGGIGFMDVSGSGSAAVIDLTAQAEGRIGTLWTGAGTAQIGLYSPSPRPRQYRLVHGAGMAAFTVEALFKITGPIRDLPFVDAPRERLFMMPRECRTFIVPRGEERTTGYNDVPRYSDGEVALDLIMDAGTYGESSTIQAIDLLEQIVKVKMPNNIWSEPV